MIPSGGPEPEHGGGPPIDTSASRAANAGGDHDGVLPAAVAAAAAPAAECAGAALQS